MAQPVNRAANRRRLESLGTLWAEELGYDLASFGVGSNLHWALVAFQARLESYELSEFGLSMSEFITLWSLALFEEVPSTVLAAEVGLAPSSMTGLLGRLADRGLLNRERAKDDGRSVLVTLTEEGQQMAADSFKSVNQVAQLMTENFSPTQKQELASMLRAMADACEAEVEGDSEPDDQSWSSAG